MNEKSHGRSFRLFSPSCTRSLRCYWRTQSLPWRFLEGITPRKELRTGFTTTNAKLKKKKKKKKNTSKPDILRKATQARPFKRVRKVPRFNDCSGYPRSIMRVKTSQLVYDCCPEVFGVESCQTKHFYQRVLVVDIAFNMFKCSRTQILSSRETKLSMPTPISSECIPSRMMIFHDPVKKTRTKRVFE